MLPPAKQSLKGDDKYNDHCHPLLSWIPRKIRTLAALAFIAYIIVALVWKYLLK